MDILTSLSIKTGLSVTTCGELFMSGYEYIEELNKPPRWERRLIQVTKD